MVRVWVRAVNRKVSVVWVFAAASGPAGVTSRGDGFDLDVAGVVDPLICMISPRFSKIRLSGMSLQNMKAVQGRRKPAQSVRWVSTHLIFQNIFVTYSRIMTIIGTPSAQAMIPFMTVSFVSLNWWYNALWLGRVPGR